MLVGWSSFLNAFPTPHDLARQGAYQIVPYLAPYYFARLAQRAGVLAIVAQAGPVSIVVKAQ